MQVVLHTVRKRYASWRRRTCPEKIRTTNPPGRLVLAQCRLPWSTPVSEQSFLW